MVGFGSFSCSGKIDFMISPTGLLTDPPDIQREVMLRDALTLIMRRKHPLARRKALSLADLRDAQWVMPNAQTTMWRQVEALFAAENEPWPIDCVTTDSITALTQLVMRSDCVSISSKKLVTLETRAGSIVCVPLRNPHFSREICLRQRRSAELQPVAQRFVVALRSVAAELRKTGSK